MVLNIRSESEYQATLVELEISRHIEELIGHFIEHLKNNSFDDTEGSDNLVTVCNKTNKIMIFF